MALYTQDRIIETMKAMIQEKPLDKITVQELVGRAKVNRKTFYFHFHGIADLINWMYRAELNEMIATKPITPLTWPDRFSAIMQRMRTDEKIINGIYRSSYWPEFRSHLTRYFDRITERFVRSAVSIFEQETHTELFLTQKQYNYIIRYYSMAFFGMVEQWFLTGMQDSGEEFVRIMKHLNRDNMYRTFVAMNAENRAEES